MNMHTTTLRLTTAASALSLGLMLSGSLATAADPPAATLSTATPAVETYPSWTFEERKQHWQQLQESARDLWAKVDLTPEQRQQYWEQTQQSARELWAKWGLSPEQSQRYWAQIQRGWNDLEAMISPPAASTPAIAAMAAGAAQSTAPYSAANPPMRIHNPLAQWRMTPEQRQQYWEYMQRGG